MLYTIKQQKIKQVSSKLVEEKSAFLTFRFMIPYRIPINNGSSFLFDDSSFFICLHREFPHYGSKELYESMKVNMSIIEITIKLDGNVKIDVFNNRIGKNQLDDILNNSFNSLLFKLNKVITALLIKHGYLNMYKLIPKDIIGVPIYSIYIVKNGKYQEITNGIFLLDRYWDMQLFNQSNISKGDYTSLVYNYEEIFNSPIKQTTLYYRNSKRFYQLGDYDTAIVNCNTSYETYVRFFVIEYYRQTQEKSNEKIKKIKECNFKSLVEDHFLVIITDKLKLKNSDIINLLVDKYKIEAYPLRNQIIHEGLEMDMEEASNVISLFEDILRIITRDIKYMDYNSFAEYYNYFYILKSDINVTSIKNKYNLK